MANDRTTTLAVRCKITRTDAVVEAYTDHDGDLVIGGVTYIATAGFIPSAVQTNVELSPDNVDLVGATNSGDVDSNDIQAGVYDFAAVEVAMIDYTDLVSGDVFPPVNGKLGKIRFTKNTFHVEIESLAAQLQQTIGRVYSELCDTDIGSTRCGFTVIPDTLTVTGVTDNRRFADSSVTEDDGEYDWGSLTWTTGGNSGFQADIRGYLKAGGSFELYEPMPVDVQVGDQATIAVGCAKTKSECITRYSNMKNHRGFSYIPGLRELIKN